MMGSYVFFLGGYDAEMVEILRILQNKKISYYDKKLGWGAGMSAYEMEISALPTDKKPVFIELKLDLPLPENAIIIDHHDKNAGKDRPSSLEQVADLLDFTLHRRQQLISANDKGHIRGMERLCATTDEIYDIRKLDRQAQGVTKEDEDRAEESINERLEEINENAALVQSLTDKTSPVFDRLYGRYDHIVVLTPNGQMTYSGLGQVVELLKEKYAALKEQGPSVEYWFGGEMPDYGYFGANTILPIAEMKPLFQRKIYSQHIFMFPFTLKWKDDRISLPWDEITSALSENYWKEKRFDPEASRLKYSEFFYFHPFVRNGFFTLDATEGPSSRPMMRYFQRKTGSEAVFRVWVKANDKKRKQYELEIRGIALRVFETGIGVLSLELENLKYPLAEDILSINDSGRRIYPQFLGEKGGVEDTKWAFLADSIEIVAEDLHSEEDFDECRFRKRYLVLARYIQDLLGCAFTSNTYEFYRPDGKTPFLIQPTIDDRMYVVCWYGSDRVSEKLRCRTPNGDYGYENSELWYRFIFHDGKSKACWHPGMLRNLVKGATYERWADLGSFYGISRYGLMCITPLNNFFDYEIIREHMRRQYAQMAVILLAQRASILKFSEQVSKISGQINEKLTSFEKSSEQADRHEFNVLAEGVERLHAAYIRFVNGLWFTEVTPQEQGLEMYNQAVRIMHLKEEMADLKNEIKELYEFVGITYDRIRMEDDRKSNQQMKILTILGAIFLPFMVLTGFLGINTFFIEKGLQSYLTPLLQSFGWMQESQAGEVALPGMILLTLASVVAFLILWWFCYRLMRGYLKQMEGEQLKVLDYLSLRQLWRSIRQKKGTGANSSERSKS